MQIQRENNTNKIPINYKRNTTPMQIQCKYNKNAIRIQYK